MKKIAFLLLFLSLTTLANAYTDLNEDNPHYQAINYLSEENIFNGYNDGTFKSESFINRAEFLKILLLGFVDAEFPEDIESNFYDVSINDWHSKYINYSFAQGWVDGYGGGYFRPENNINLAEALKLISLVTDSTPYQEDYFITTDDIKLHFDDFGTGHSQVNYLKSLLERNYNNPMIVLLDETGNMSEKTIKVLYTVLKKLYNDGKILAGFLVKPGLKPIVKSII